MSHGIEENDTLLIGGSVNNELLPAWHGMGNMIPEHVLTANEAIEAAGLTWEVEQRDIFSPTEIYNEETKEIEEKQLDIPEMYANWSVDPDMTREDIFLGIVGDRYEVVQNREAFEFCDMLVDSGEAKFHTAGSLFNHKQVFMLMKVPDPIIIGGMEDEAIDRFILFHHSHDGSKKIRVTPTGVRVVCNNTVRAAQAGAKNSWEMRHTSELAGKINEARTAMGISFGYFDAIEDMGNNLVGQSFTAADWNNLMDELMPLPEEGESKGSKVAFSRVNNRRESLNEIYTGADNLNNIRGTKWGAYQAVIEWRDHHSEQREQKNASHEVRFNRIIEGKDKMILKTQELLTA